MPPRHAYRVFGIDRDSGFETMLVVTATSDEKAKAQAEAKGMEVRRIETPKEAEIEALHAVCKERKVAQHEFREREFYSKIVGDSHNNPDGTSRQVLIRRCVVGEELRLVPEPNNHFDGHAIAVYRTSGQQLGYIPRDTADELAECMEAGMACQAFISDLTGGTSDKPTRGVNLLIAVNKEPVAAPPPRETITANYWCPQCHNFTDGRGVTGGSFIIEVILWCCFLVPGLIYSVWRMTAKSRVCTGCGAANIVPSTSPAAAEYIRSQGWDVEVKPHWKLEMSGCLIALIVLGALFLIAFIRSLLY